MLKMYAKALAYEKVFINLNLHYKEWVSEI